MLDGTLAPGKPTLRIDRGARSALPSSGEGRLVLTSHARVGPLPRSAQFSRQQERRGDADPTSPPQRAKPTLPDQPIIVVLDTFSSIARRKTRPDFSFFVVPNLVGRSPKNRVRAEEVRVLLKATLLRAVNEAMFFVQPAVVSCLVFATYHLLGNVLKPQQVSLYARYPRPSSASLNRTDGAFPPLYIRYSV